MKIDDTKIFKRSLFLLISQTCTNMKSINEIFKALNQENAMDFTDCQGKTKSNNNKNTKH